MELTDDMKRIAFPSVKTYSDICDAYVELGMRRIIDYYENTNIGTTIPNMYETTLLNIEDTKVMMRYFGIPIPVDVLEMEHKIAEDIISHLELQKETFEELIAKTELDSWYKTIAGEYLEEKHEEATIIFKKYLIND